MTAQASYPNSMKERKREQSEQEEGSSFSSASEVTRDLLGANWSNQRGLVQIEDHSNKPQSSSFPLDTGSSLELNLFPSKCYNNSVCTLDKVKSALERARRSETDKKRREITTSFFPSSACQVVEEDEVDNGDKGAFAACCPGCLMYVLTWKSNPKCPHCGTIIVPLSPTILTAMKRPEIDLNSSHN